MYSKIDTHVKLTGTHSQEVVNF